MFKENIQHNQDSFFNSTNWMDRSVANKLSKTWAPIFYEKVFCKIDEKPFAILYSGNGRSNFPVNILLSLEYIKYILTYTDDELIENYYFNYLVNYALGIRTLGEKNLAERTLYDFRERIYNYCLNHPEEEDIIFGQFISLTKGFIEESGISTKEQRMDSTMIMPNIKKAGRLSLCFDVLIKIIEIIPEDMRTDNLKAALVPKFKTDVLYKTKANEATTKLEKVLFLCKEAILICENNKELKNKEEVVIAKRLISEQLETDTNTMNIKVKDKSKISSNSLQSAYDKDATYREKAGKKQSGYVVNITETCTTENQLQLITDYALERNTKSDTQMAIERIPEVEKNTDCEDMYADGGYYSKDVIDKSKENGITIHYTDMTGKEPAKDKLTPAQFEYSEKDSIISACPLDNKPTRSSKTKDQVVAYFNEETCSHCLLLENCPAKKQKKGYVVRLSLKNIEASNQRKEIKNNIKENTSKRAAIEGTNSALKRKQGLGKLKVRGKHKCKVVAGLIMTAHNFIKFAKYTLNITKTKSKNPIRAIGAPIFQ